MASRLASAVIFGFGSAAGRDAWRVAKRSTGSIILFVIIFSAAALPFFAGLNLTRGYPQQHWFASVGRAALSIALALSGFAIGEVVLTAILVSLSTKPQSGWAPPDIPIVVATGSAIVGALVGVFQRRKRIRQFAAAADNERFMRQNGIVETGGKDVTHTDAEGNTLRFLEAHPSRLVFLAVGRKNKRAFIELAPDGRMLSYSGVVPASSSSTA